MVDQIRFFAGAARVLEGRSAGEYMAGHTSYVRREPIGVIGQVTPWNYPMMMAVWKFAPAIAAGNTVVLKPSDTTPETTLLLAEIAAEFLPPGVFNVVTGDRDTGRAVVEHPTPAMVVDHRLGPGRHGGGRERRRTDLKRVHLELGGKAPVDRVRRRRPRGGRRGHRDRRLLQRRAGLHRRDPRARRARASTTTSSRRSPSRPRLGQGRPARRRRRAARPGQQPRPARAGDGLPRPAARPRVARGRRRAGRRRSATATSSSRPSCPGCAGRRGDPGRDLRPGHHRAAVQRRGRGGALGQRRRVRAGVERVDQDVGRAMRMRRRWTSAASGSTPTSRSSPRCRTAASSTPATARTCRCTASRTTRASSTS